MSACWRLRSILACSLAFIAWAMAAVASAEPAPVTFAVATAPDAMPLQLEVIRNGEETGLIAAFRRRADGELAAAASELRAIGLAVAGEGEIALTALPGVSYRYDDEGQRVYITAAPEAVQPTRISLREERPRAEPAQDWGALLNYSLAVEAGSAHGFAPRARAASGAFEARAFGPLGMVSSSAVATVREGRNQTVRLDTGWVHVDVDKAVVWRAGDLITGGLPWTRPLRLGGLQYARDFASRPDMVTQPTPSLSSSAAVPSTLEVLLGPSVVLSRKVSAGPVQVTDLPTQGQGTARLILRDSFGMQHEVSAAFFATPQLLRPGLADFSLEAGFARRRFGVRSADYDGDLVFSGTGRLGLTDSLTLQGHAEGGAGLVNAGGGVVRRLGSYALVSGAVAASHTSRDDGALVSVALDARARWGSLYVGAQQTAGRYRDLVSVTAPRFAPSFRDDLADPPRRQLQVSGSAPLNLAIFERGGRFPTFGVSYARLENRHGPARSLFSSTLRYALGHDIDLEAAVYAEGSQARDRGFFVSLTAPLGGSRTASAGASRAAGRTTGFAEVRQQEADDPGAAGWRLRVDRARETAVGADLVYRAPLARLYAQATYIGGATSLVGRAEGALVWLNGPFLAPERLDGAFAAVDTAVPGVKVSFQNRPIGVTRADGRLLVPRLNAYEQNLVSIDAGDLPLSLSVPTTRLIVSPGYGAGARAAFGIARAPAQGVLRLRLADGSAPAAGSPASLGGGPFDQVVGYDGELYLADAAAVTHVDIDLGGGARCRAQVQAQAFSEERHVAVADCR